MLFALCCKLFVDVWLLFVACCVCRLSHTVCRLLFVVRGLAGCNAMVADCCSLHGACRLLMLVRCLLGAVCSALFAECCLLDAVGCVLVGMCGTLCVV